MDTDGLRETTKRLTREVAMLKQQNSELKEQNESLSKRCENYRSSSEVLREMMQKQPGMVWLKLQFLFYCSNLKLFVLDA